MISATSNSHHTHPGNVATVDCSKLKNLSLRYERSVGVLWKYIAKESTLYFSHSQLDDIRAVQSAIRDGTRLSLPGYEHNDLKYVVFGSHHPNVFSLGGDLKLFRDLIEKQDRNGLIAYSRKATDAIVHHAGNASSVITFSLVQGAAMGGGFEAALAGNVVIAEKGARLGFPEVLFGLFPGMGAYTLLRRRVDSAMAEKIILGARIYSAEELLEIGVVDEVCSPGDGEKAVYSYISRQANRPGAIAFQRALNRANVINRKEIYSISDDWIETAMSLNKDSLRRIDRLVSSQRRFYSSLNRSILPALTIKLR